MRRYSPVVAFLDAIEQHLKAWGRGHVTAVLSATEVACVIVFPMLPAPAWAGLLTMLIIAFVAVTAWVVIPGPDRE